MNEDLPPDTVRPSNRPPSIRVHEDDGETISVPPPSPLTTDDRLDRIEQTQERILTALDRVLQRVGDFDGRLDTMERHNNMTLDYVREIAERESVRARLHLVSDATAKPTNGAGS